MPLIATKGAASAQGFGEFAQTTEPVYIEQIFSTYLYTGNGSTRSISNGIDLAGKGGLVWSKARSDVDNNRLYDTVRGTNTVIISNSTSAQLTDSNTVTAFNSDGYSLGTSGNVNLNGTTFVSWTFRKQPKFFDIVTYTGNGAASRNIAHSLGATPGCIICKATSISENWGVYHRSTGANGLYLNGTNSAGVTLVPTGHTSTTFEVADGYGLNNVNGVTYVAYLFAHDAGGFGLTGSDNVISCGSVTTNGSGEATVTLNYEPQWLLLKPSSTTGNWLMVDTMRGWNVNASGNIQRLRANLSDAEDLGGQLNPTATGFKTSASGALAASTTYIYIAIRRGPMKTPTTGTSVFSPLLTTNSTGATNTTGFPVDLQLWTLTGGYQTTAQDRLRGVSTTSTQTSCPELLVPYSSAESSNAFQVRNWNNTGFETPSAVSGSSTIWWNFRRAPGFFDEICYTGNGSFAMRNHNLTVPPELVITKARNANVVWYVVRPNPVSKYLILNQTDAESPINFPVTSTTTGVTGDTVGETYVYYLFASVAGVSKVGSYTGTGALQTVNCGFTGGARFILIKRTDSTGDWYVYDSARGISSGNDPYILINVAGAAQVTGTNYVDTTSVGFQVTAAAPAGLNANGGSYLFLAIA